MSGYLYVSLRDNGKNSLVQTCVPVCLLENIPRVVELFLLVLQDLKEGM